MPVPLRFLGILLVIAAYGCRQPQAEQAPAAPPDSPPPAEQIEEHIAYGRPATVAPSISSRFGAGSLLTDGRPGRPDSLSTFAGIAGDEFTLTIDLGEPLMAERLRAGFLFAPQQQIALPDTVEFSISTDSIVFKSRGRIPVSLPAGKAPAQIVSLSVEMRAQSVRYVRLHAFRHPANGREARWMLIDELWLE